MSKALTSHFLARWLLDHDDLPVQVETETMICPLSASGLDCFDADEGMVVVLVPDLSDDA